MVILSPGSLPSPLTPETLKHVHRSHLRNRKIAEMFYYAGWIEAWGSGIQKILSECAQMGLPEPEWRDEQYTVWLTFRKDILTEDYLRSLGLNERQIKAVLWVKEKGSITNRQYRELTGLSDEGARRDLNVLVKRCILRREGKGRKSAIPAAFEYGSAGSNPHPCRSQQGYPHRYPARNHPVRPSRRGPIHGFSIADRTL